MQGLNTTPVHGHTALFGVYDVLGIGLMLFVLKGMAARHVWKDGVISFAFWSINIGLGLMVLISVLPVGLLQTWASVEHGLWYARSMEFMQTDTMEILRWLRVIGDTVFAAGVVALAWFVVGLKIGWSLNGRLDISPEHYPVIEEHRPVKKSQPAAKEKSLRAFCFPTSASSTRPPKQALSCPAPPSAASRTRST